MSGNKLNIVFTANSCFAIYNFRRGLVHNLLSAGHKITVVAPKDETTDSLIDVGCDFCDLPMKRNGKNPFSEFLLLSRVYRAVRYYRPDVVFSFTIKNNIYGGLSCRWLGIPFVPNVTGLGPAFDANLVLQKVILVLYRLAFARSPVVFFQNQGDQHVFQSAVIVSKAQSVILPGSGVNLERFNFVPLPTKNTEITFLLVSRLLWNKGIGIYAEAVRCLKSRYPFLKFRLLGPFDNCSQQGISTKLVDAWKTEGLIDYLGVATDVRDLMADADCIVLPTWYREGTPKVLLEAAALGRPIITTNIDGCRDSVIDGETGFLCEAKSVDSFVRAVTKFIEMTVDERKKMGFEARKYASEKFDEEIVISAYLKVLEKLKTSEI